MKLSKIIMTVFTIGMMLSSCVTSTRITPRKNVTVTRVQNPQIIVYKNVNYYHSSGIWYRKRGNRFVVVSPPNGLTIRRLPKNYKVVTIRKNKYYTYNGVYYKKSNRGYIVVKV
ncbi:hypothetical protein GTQ40_03235 [Flavobacteriaceae bacterium R38]|nr:hypothetical protein [Flavobacteriaceae bacterium R38]